MFLSIFGKKGVYAVHVTHMQSIVAHTNIPKYISSFQKHSLWKFPSDYFDFSIAARFFPILGIRRNVHWPCDPLTKYYESLLRPKLISTAPFLISKLIIPYGNFHDLFSAIQLLYYPIKPMCTDVGILLKADSYNMSTTLIDIKVQMYHKCSK